MRLIVPLFRDREDTPCKRRRKTATQHQRRCHSQQNIENMTRTTIKNVTTSNCGREDDVAFIEFNNFRNRISVVNFLSSATVADWTRRKYHILSRFQSEGCCEMTLTCFHMTFSDVIFASIETTLTYHSNTAGLTEVQLSSTQTSFNTFCFKLLGSVIVYLPFV